MTVSTCALAAVRGVAVGDEPGLWTAWPAACGAHCRRLAFGKGGSGGGLVRPAAVAGSAAAAVAVTRFPRAGPSLGGGGCGGGETLAGRGPVLASPSPPTFRRPLVAAAAATTAAVASIGVGGPSPPPHPCGLSPGRPPVAEGARRARRLAVAFTPRAPPRGSPPHCLLSPPLSPFGARASPAASRPRFVTRATRGGVTRSVVAATGVGARAGRPQ